MMSPVLKHLTQALQQAARVEIFVIALAWLMILLTLGTLAQAKLGLYEAQHAYFSTLFFWWGIMPLPGGYLTMGVIFINLLSKLIWFSPWTRSQAGVSITHMGALLLLFGGFLTAFYNTEGYVKLGEGERSSVFVDYQDDALRYELPFAVELIDFEKTMYPGTMKAKSYQSDIWIIEEGGKWKTRISMNNPLRYKGYTFFQSSFVLEGGKEFTVLTVVDNVGWLFPYISSIIMCLGLLIHIVLRVPKLMRVK